MKDSYQGETFDIVSLSDSLSALEALKDCNHFERNINKTLTIISEIQESGRKVTLVWVLAHVGIPGNEKADALAKAATTREQIDRWIPASIKDIKRAITSSNSGKTDGSLTHEANTTRLYRNSCRLRASSNVP